MKKKPDDSFEQKMSSDISTRDFISECKKEFHVCIQKIFNKISNSILKESKIPTAKIKKNANICFRKYFQSTKGSTNLSSEDIRTIIYWEIDKQKKLNRAIKHLMKQLDEYDIKTQILESEFYFGETLWNTGIEPGYKIFIDNQNYIFAFPLTSAKTSDYLVPRSGPVSAEILYLDKDCLIMMPLGEELSDKFSKAITQLWGAPSNITNQFADVHVVYKYRNFIKLDIVKEIDTSELNRILNMYVINAVLKGDPNEFKALIHTGKEDQLPKLLQELSEY